MSGPAAALTWVQIVVGCITIIGVVGAVVRSAYRGYVHEYIIKPKRQAEEAHSRMDEIAETINSLDDKMDSVAEQQEIHTDVLIAVGKAANNGQDFDVSQFRECVGKDGEDRFLTDSADD